ncbi:hypothetical protein [Flavobacterium sp.]|uniref:hypothetical protein n=1 Tax=Flavobacterium sp. TaxID=239 RepID=UPI0026219936|nr:hypothetical protein [Flavobacterium sp.]
MKRIIVLLFFVSSALMAQKTKVVSGNFENLKGITEYNLVFDYVCDNVVGYPENVYINQRMQIYADEYNGIGNPKAGEIFKNSWYSNKKKFYEPTFIRSFNKRFDGEVKMGSNLTTAKYTATLKTTYMSPGCMGCGGISSRTNAVITITETANPNNVLLVYNFIMAEKVPVKTEKDKFKGVFDPEPGERVSEDYAKFAKMFATDLKKFNK